MSVLCSSPPMPSHFRIKDKNLYNDLPVTMLLFILLSSTLPLAPSIPTQPTSALGFVETPGMHLLRALALSSLPRTLFT